MVSTNDVQRAYNDLYVELRKYIWSFDVVKAIADLEIATYQTFPDLTEVDRCLRNLKVLIFNEVAEDEYLKEAVDKFEELIKDQPEIFYKLNELTGVTE